MTPAASLRRPALAYAAASRRLADSPAGSFELPDLDVEPGVAAWKLITVKELILVRIDVRRHDRLKVLDSSVKIALLEMCDPRDEMRRGGLVLGTGGSQKHEVSGAA
jgi:hypothetical protein